MLSTNAFAVIALGLGLSAAGVCRADEVRADGDPVLGSLIEEALARNPAIAAARALEQAAATKGIQAGSRPGPSFGLLYENDGVSPSLGREPMTILGLSAGQEIPYPGKRALRRQVAEADAGLAAFDLERSRLGLVASVKSAYYGLWLARGLADVAAEQGAVWREVQETARVRHASGVGSQQEMLRAQVEATRVQALHAQHHAEARARLAQINALLGRAADVDVETPPAPALALAADARPADSIVRSTEEISPELNAALRSIERDDRAVALARREFKPDFNVQGGVGFRGALPPMWQAGASVMLPSKSRVKAALAEAEARLAASNARRDEVRLRLRAAVETRLVALDAIRHIEETYREGLLPQGEIAVQSATATYAAGQGSQVAVLQAAAALLDDRTDYLRLLATYATERARLEEATLEPSTGMEPVLMHGSTR